MSKPPKNHFIINIISNDQNIKITALLKILFSKIRMNYIYLTLSKSKIKCKFEEILIDYVIGIFTLAKVLMAPKTLLGWKASRSHSHISYI
jgi:hypothetical protein